MNNLKNIIAEMTSLEYIKKRDILRKGTGRSKRHHYYLLKACGDHSPVATSETLI